MKKWKFKGNDQWLKNINFNIGFQQGFPLFPTLLSVYIDKIESHLEEVGFTGTTLSRIVIILILYADDIVLMVMCQFDLDKQ